MSTHSCTNILSYVYIEYDETVDVLLRDLQFA